MGAEKNKANQITQKEQGECHQHHQEDRVSFICSNEFPHSCSTLLREANLWDISFGFDFEFEEITFCEVERSGDDVRGEHLCFVVEEEYLVVVSLS